MRLLLSIFLVVVSTVLNGQLATDYGAPVLWVSPKAGEQMRGIDTLTNDTIILTLNYYVRISERGKLIEQLILSKPVGPFSCTDEGPKLSGTWRKWHELGKLAEEGKYNCNSKIGKWRYYYENGNVFVEEFYLRSDSLVSKIFGFRFGERREYYPTGIIKMTENFEVVEVLDSIVVIDIETYKEIKECCQWRPISVRSGLKKEYDIDGKVIKSTIHAIEEDQYLRIRYIDGLGERD